MCLVAGIQETIAHLDRVQYVLGYMPEQSKIYLIDKDLNVSPFTLHMSLIDYQSAILRKDFSAAEGFFKQLPESMHTRVARFLENQGYAAEALQISKDDEHRFELATQLGKLQLAADIVESISAQPNVAVPPRGKWKTLGDVALEQGEFALAVRCFSEAKDLSGLFLLQTANGDAKQLANTAIMAKEAGVANVAVLCCFLLGDVKGALDVLINVKRLPEAAFFAKTYCPSELSNVVKLWKDDVSQVNKAVADALADPATHPDLFPDFDLTCQAEAIFKARRESAPVKASDYMQAKDMLDIDVLEELKSLGADGFRKKIGVAANASPTTQPAAQPRQTAPETVIEAPISAAVTVPVPASVPEITASAQDPAMSSQEAAPEAALPGPETSPATEGAPLDDLLM